MKKYKLPIIITLLAAVLILGGSFAVTKYFKKEPVQVETEVETEAVELARSILIHKTNGGIITFKEEWLESENDESAFLSVPVKTLVSMNIQPKSGKTLGKVNIYDAMDVDNEIKKVVSPMDGGGYNVDFTMPDTDIVMHVSYEDVVIEDEPLTEAETEEESEKGNPYGLTLHGVTADVITSYNGQFDDQEMLKALGDALHVDSTRSEYYGTTDVTYSAENVEGELSDDKVYYYLYLDLDPTRKILSTYSLKEKKYEFSKPVVRETERQVQETPAPSSQTTGTGTYSGSTTQTQGYVQQPVKTVYEVSLDIMHVSETFLDFTGGSKSKFYDQVFSYVSDKKGLRGTLVGTFVSYKIDPDKKTASFEITLNNGKTVTGSYEQKSDSYSFNYS